MFYCFNQNNSGGSFTFDPESGISHYVIIEADDREEAVYRAGRIGLYFNGIDSGYDCSCCGDRWSEPWDEKGSNVPRIYNDGEEIEPYSQFQKKSWYTKWMDGPEGYIHYKDGSFKPFWDKGNDQ